MSFNLFSFLIWNFQSSKQIQKITNVTSGFDFIARLSLYFFNFTDLDLSGPVSVLSFYFKMSVYIYVTIKWAVSVNTEK